MDNTIELWESEIAENNKSHFFENINKEIGYLSESIDLDFKLLEMGILTEADEESGSNSDEKSTSLKDRIKDKINNIFDRIITALEKLYRNITAFIKEKLSALKFKQLEKQIKDGKINEVDLADKLNKGKNIFDMYDLKNKYIKPLHDYIIDYDFAGNDKKKASDDLSKIATIADDLSNYDEFTKNLKPFTFNPSNAASQFVNLLNQSNDTLDYISGITRTAEKKVEKIYDKIKKEDNIDKEFYKWNIQVLTTLNTSLQRITKICLKQTSFLLSVTRGLASNTNTES